MTVHWSGSQRSKPHVMTNARPEERKRKLHITAEKIGYNKESNANRTKSEFTSHCRIAAKTNFLMLLLFPARFAHARYSSRMIDRFLNWGDHGKPKSGKIKGRCQPPLIMRLRNQASLILKEHQHSYFVTRFFFPVQSYFILMY